MCYTPIPNPYPGNSLWIGKRYNDPTNTLRGAFILGESTHSKPDATDPQWINYFINKKWKKELVYDWHNIDQTFSRLRLFMNTETDKPAETWVKLSERTSSADERLV